MEAEKIDEKKIFDPNNNANGIIQATWIRFISYVTNVTAKGALPVEGSLRTFQDLNTLDIKDRTHALTDTSVRAVGDRHVVHVKTDRRTATRSRRSDASD